MSIALPGLMKSLVSGALSLVCVVGLSPGLAFAQGESSVVENSSTESIGDASYAGQASGASSAADVEALSETTPGNGSNASSTEGGDGDEVSLDAPDTEPTIQSEEATPLKKSVADVSVSGLFAVGSALPSGRVLDVNGGSLLAGAALQIWSANCTPAQRYRFDLGADGYYTITNIKSGKVLDVLGAENISGAVVQQYDANGTDAQKWSIFVDDDGTYTISSKLKTPDDGELMLDIHGASDADGARIQLYSANGTSAQKWILQPVTPVVDDGWYTVTSSLSSSLVLDIDSGSLDSGGNVQVYSSNGTLAQRFRFQYQADTGYYLIYSGVSGLVLDVEGAGTSDGTNVQQYASNGTLAQRWAIVKNADGSLRISSAGSGLSLDVYAGNSQPGTNVQIWSSNGTLAQGWALVSTSLVQDGVYTFACSASRDCVLDISAGSCQEGGRLQVWSSNGTNAQKFAVSLYGDGYYTIRNINSGLLLGLAGGSVQEGTNVDQGYAGIADSQLWRPEAAVGGIVWYTKSGMAMDVAGGVLASGTEVRAWPYNGSAAQKFSLVPASASFSEGIYTVASALDVRRVLDIPNASTSNSVLPQLYTANGSAAQRFYIASTGSGYYRITALCSNKSLDVKDYYINPDTGSGAVQQWTTSNNEAQNWLVQSTSDGYFTFYSQCGTGNSVLDVDGGVASDGVLVGVYGSNTTLAQKFVLQPASSMVSYRAMNMSLADQAGYQLTSYHTYDEYYEAMNPDKAGSMTVFADLRGYSGLSSDQLNAYIASTGTGRSGNLMNMGYAFVLAAKAYNLNEAYVLSHAILESGWGTSDLAKGYYYAGGWIDDSYYEAGTYYNYFGIGAYDDSPLSGGRKLAIVNGWNSPETAIMGGAAWIADGYTYASSYPQYTLYDMKYDTLRSNATMARGWHQYATSLTWANSIATLVDKCYANSGISPIMSYVIPRYQ